MVKNEINKSEKMIGEKSAKYHSWIIWWYLTKANLGTKTLDDLITMSVRYV